MNKPKAPIFISGHIKSGTSLMISLLDGHSKLLAFPEELFFFNKLEKLKKERKLLVSDFWNLFFSDTQIKRLFSGEQSGLFGNVDYTHFDGIGFEFECRKAFAADALIAQNERRIFEMIFYSYQFVSKSPADLIWVEKSPTNERNFKTLMNWYPDCKFIYLRRNPLEVYAAVKKKRQKEGVKYPISHFLNNYKTSTRKADKLAKEYPNNFMIVYYEQLIAAKDKTIRQIISFLNIEMEDILLNPTKNGTRWKGNSMFRDNNAEGIQADNLKHLRLSTLTPTEKQVIEDVIVKSSWSLKSNLFFLKADWKRFLKTQFPILTKSTL